MPDREGVSLGVAPNDSVDVGVPVTEGVLDPVSVVVAVPVGDGVGDGEVVMEGV